MFTTNKSSKVLANKLPVYNLQPLYTLHTYPTPTVEVGSTSISIVNIVGMLPHIAAEQRLHSIYRSLALPKHTTNRITCICGADDIQRAVSLLHQPRPSRSEEAHSLWAKLLDKGVIRAPLRLNSRLQRTIFQRTASVTHTLSFSQLLGKYVPIEGMIPNLSSVIENASLSSLNQLFQGSASIGKQVIKIIDIARSYKYRIAYVWWCFP